MATPEQEAEAQRLSGQDTSIAKREAENASAHKGSNKKPTVKPSAAGSSVPSRTGDKARMFEVIDSSATVDNPKRTHEIIINGRIKAHIFEYGKPTLMPFIEAMKFQKDGFTIKDDEGNEIQHAPETKLEDVSTFGPDRVIARLDELRRDALFARATVMPGGESFNQQTSVEVLITFLEQSARKKLAENSRRSTEVGIDVREPDGMSEAELDGMMAAE